jgi:hypothetical protein
MDSAQVGLRRLLERYAAARSEPAEEPTPVARGHLDAFDEGISDDLNTAKALVAVTAASRDELLSERELSPPLP